MMENANYQTETICQEEKLPLNTIVNKFNINKVDGSKWIINFHCPYLLSNALQFNLFEEIPLVKGLYYNVAHILFKILKNQEYRIVTELNIFFKDCHLIVLKDKGQNIPEIIEDILSNLFQHLPNFSKHGDIIPEVIYIPLQITGQNAMNSCFKKWGLYYPNDNELMVYSLKEKYLTILNHNKIANLII